MTETKLTCHGYNAWFFQIVVTTSFLFGVTGYAQAPAQQILELNRQAMDAFLELEMKQAEQLLEQAREIAKNKDVGGTPLARTLLNLGIVQVAGFQNESKGREYFSEALKVDPGVELDPTIATPKVKAVFNSAQEGQSPIPQTFSASSRPPGNRPWQLPHTPAPEQLAHTGVPVYVQVPRELKVEEVVLIYWGSHTEGYEEWTMDKISGGYAAEIPCWNVFEPVIYYYVIAYDGTRNQIAMIGAPGKPIAVPIVSRRTHPAPSLPNKLPPRECTVQACPTGIPGCRETTGDVGTPCTTTDDCRESFDCVHGICHAATLGEDGWWPYPLPDPPRVFLHAGISYGAGLATRGMEADRSPPPELPESASFIPAGEEGCGLSGTGQYCVQVGSRHLVPTLAVHATVGYYITARIAAALSLRFQPDAGNGTLSHFLLGGRVQYLLTQPHQEGFHPAIFVGTSVGQIQIKPSQEALPEPFIVSGLNSIQVGASLVYRLIRGLGLHITPQFHFLFPDFLFHMEMNAGLEIGL